MSLKSLFLFLLVSSCASVQSPSNPEAPKEFAQGEVILATQLLVKIFDQEMAPVACVPDVDEASLLLRTIRPRMEAVEDDIEAQLDDAQAVSALINKCDQSCTCAHLDDLLREHLVTLTKEQKSDLATKRTDKEVARCMNFAQSTFCQSDLYKELNREKADFSFEE